MYMCEYALKSWINRANKLCLSITYSVQMLVCFDGLIAREIVKLWRYIYIYIYIYYMCVRMCLHANLLNSYKHKISKRLFGHNSMLAFPTKLLSVSFCKSRQQFCIDVKRTLRHIHTNTNSDNIMESTKFFRMQMKCSSFSYYTHINIYTAKKRKGDRDWKRASAKLT